MENNDPNLNKYCQECHQIISVEQNHCLGCHENYDLDEQHCPDCHENYDKDIVHKHNNVLNNSENYKSSINTDNTDGTIELILEFGSTEATSSSSKSDVISNQIVDPGQQIKYSFNDQEKEDRGNNQNKSSKKTLDFDNNYSFFTIF